MPSRYEGDSAVATAPVVENGQELGRVHVRLLGGSGLSPWMRYLGIGLLLVMAAVLVGVIALGQRTLAAANDELTRRAGTLFEANERLQNEVESRQRAERALAQAQKMEAIGQLTGGLAHDFNNILAAISGGVRLLERSPAQEQRATIRAGLDEAVQRGARLTRQLLGFARGQNLEPQVIDPCARIGAMLELVRRTIGEDIGVNTSFPASRWHVRVDPNQLELVILNLAVNARDAMPAGGRLTIACSTVLRTDAPAGEFVRLSVSDTGFGMDRETTDRAFEPFFTTKEVGKGTGLGLAQVYAFSRHAGGLAWIESEEGRGTTVHLDLPRVAGVETSTAGELPTATDPGPVEGVPGGAGRRILVVEDDDAVAQVVCNLLQANDYVCVRTASAKEALVQAEKDRFDLVFSDIVMPGGMSGVDLARDLRQRKPSLPILLTTGFAGKAHMDPGEFEVLYKPWTPDGLLKALHQRLATGTAPETARETSA
jgi:signal transduction histidine kinase/ActR/RegA family two-component response regulator